MQASTGAISTLHYFFLSRFCRTLSKIVIGGVLVNVPEQVKQTFGLLTPNTNYEASKKKSFANVDEGRRAVEPAYSMSSQGALSLGKLKPQTLFGVI